MNILCKITQEFRPAQFKKGFATDALLVPNKTQRWFLYVLLLLSIIVSSVSLSRHWYELALLSAYLVTMVMCKFVIEAYRYIQSKEDEHK